MGVKFMTSPDSTFQMKANLRGVLDLFSRHLYSSPAVFVRETLKNSVDAVRARSMLQPENKPLPIDITLSPGQSFTIRDFGAGLDEAGIHDFLSTIAQSSKRSPDEGDRDEFIGQFGIGLLACFLVSEEIHLVTRSAATDAPVLEWVAATDGTYRLRDVTDEKGGDFEPGTWLRLTAKPGYESYFDFDRVSDLVKIYGDLLPLQIRIKGGDRFVVVGGENLPWQMPGARLLDYGRTKLGEDPFDAFEITVKRGGLSGVAFVLPTGPARSQRSRHRVYVKRMFVSDKVERLVPEWAYFLRCEFDATGLRPTASREDIYEDDVFYDVREEIDRAIRSYLLDLARRDRDRFEMFLKLHEGSIKKLAAEDDELRSVFLRDLSFDTTLGRMKLMEILGKFGKIRYTDDNDEYRQLAPLARQNNICILNAGFGYDGRLVASLGKEIGYDKLEPYDSSRLMVEVGASENRTNPEFHQLESKGNRFLSGFQCRLILKSFSPTHLPAVFVNQDGRTQATEDRLDEALWLSIFSKLDQDEDVEDPFQTLFLNLSNPMVQRLAAVTNENVQAIGLRLLLVSSKMVGNYRLTPDDHVDFANCLADLFDLAEKGADLE
jgi:molecular chaperone HtpG